jgi:hypothetical protein
MRDGAAFSARETKETLHICPVSLEASQAIPAKVIGVAGWHAKAPTLTQPEVNMPTMLVISSIPAPAKRFNMMQRRNASPAWAAFLADPGAVVQRQAPRLKVHNQSSARRHCPIISLARQTLVPSPIQRLQIPGTLQVTNRVKMLPQKIYPAVLRNLSQGFEV